MRSLMLEPSIIDPHDIPTTFNTFASNVAACPVTSYAIFTDASLSTTVDSSIAAVSGNTLEIK